MSISNIIRRGKEEVKRELENRKAYAKYKREIAHPELTYITTGKRPKHDVIYDEMIAREKERRAEKVAKAKKAVGGLVSKLEKMERGSARRPARTTRGHKKPTKQKTKRRPPARTSSGKSELERFWSGKNDLEKYWRTGKSHTY